MGTFLVDRIELLIIQCSCFSCHMALNGPKVSQLIVTNQRKPVLFSVYAVGYSVGWMSEGVSDSRNPTPSSPPKGFHFGGRCLTCDKGKGSPILETSVGFQS